MNENSFPETADPIEHPLQDLHRSCLGVAHTTPGNIQKIASLLQRMSLDYYRDARRQAQQSFYCALGAAAIGTAFFIYAIAIAMHSNQESTANISLIAGGLIDVISAINFVLYGRAAKQFASFHICLERVNRFILANSLCENLHDTTQQDKARAELINIVANAPMLSLNTRNGTL